MFYLLHLFSFILLENAQSNAKKEQIVLCWFPSSSLARCTYTPNKHHLSSQLISFTCISAACSSLLICCMHLLIYLLHAFIHIPAACIYSYICCMHLFIYISALTRMPHSTGGCTYTWCVACMHACMQRCLLETKQLLLLLLLQQAPACQQQQHQLRLLLLLFAWRHSPLSCGSRVAAALFAASCFCCCCCCCCCTLYCVGVCIVFICLCY